VAQSRYKREKTLKERQDESANIIKKHAGHIPVNVEKDLRSRLPDIGLQKSLVPSDLYINEFVYVIRKRIHLQATDAILLFVNRTLPIPNTTMGYLYQENRDEDGFMYCSYSSETAYGL
jgi:GABA(A) receptor-associated protein